LLIVAGMTTDTFPLDPISRPRTRARVFGRPAARRAMPAIVRSVPIGRATIAAARGQKT
jgi:hypothetical protein